jgi:hypothetical protein
MQATLLWSLWQDLLAPFAGAFTPRGFPRFGEWLTGLALNAEEQVPSTGMERGRDVTRSRPPATASRPLETIPAAKVAAQTLLCRRRAARHNPGR